MRTASLIALLSLGAAVNAQPAPEPKDGKITIPLALAPTALPKPLSRFYLTPQYKEMQPGNRVPSYMKAYMEQAEFFSKDPAADREKWNLLKLADLPLADIKKSGCVAGLAYGRAGRPLADVDEGSRLLTSDWQIWFNIRRDGIATLLPEVQNIRKLADALKVRLRYEIATGDFEKAAYTARTFFGLAQAFGTHPTLIAALVGFAVEGVCLSGLEEMIQQPGCPNLYWSLTEIPAEVVDLRIPIQGEGLLCETLFGALLNAKGEIPAAEMGRIIREIDKLIVIARGGGKRPLVASVRYAVLAGDDKTVAASRAFLIETGMKPEVVKTFSALQVIATHDARRYEADLDELLKIYGLPNADADKMAGDLDAKLKASPDPSLSAELLPTVGGVRKARVRLQQRVAYLRVIEAIRLHAFDNGGQLPATLKAIKLPLPLDPATGETFRYTVGNGVATLGGGNPMPGRPDADRVYEIRIRK